MYLKETFKVWLKTGVFLLEKIANYSHFIQLTLITWLEKSELSLINTLFSLVTLPRNKVQNAKFKKDQFLHVVALFKFTTIWIFHSRNMKVITSHQCDIPKPFFEFSTFKRQVFKRRCLLIFLKKLLLPPWQNLQKCLLIRKPWVCNFPVSGVAILNYHISRQIG